MPETQTDPIIDELRAVRDERAARFNYDVEAIPRTDGCRRRGRGRGRNMLSGARVEEGRVRGR